MNEKDHSVLSVTRENGGTGNSVLVAEQELPLSSSTLVLPHSTANIFFSVQFNEYSISHTINATFSALHVSHVPPIPYRLKTKENNFVYHW